MFERVGYFFIMVSGIVLFVFVASYMVDTPNYYLFLGGVALLIIGFYIVRRNRQQPEKAERFGLVRKMRSRKKKNGEKA
jgi:hypothetical protein